jgi:capsular exopolysaccharide synthesis family protein
MVVTLTIVVIGTYFITPVYQASALLRIAISASGSLNYSDFIYTDRLMNTYVEIATSDPVMVLLKNRINLNHAPSIKAEIVTNTEFIKITADDTDPNLAAATANALADILNEQSNQLYVGGGKRLVDVLGVQLTQVQTDLAEIQQTYEKLIIQTPPALEQIDATRQQLQLKQSNYSALLTQYEQARFRDEIQASMITVFERAKVPVSPSQPRVILNYALGLMVGLLGGIGLAFIFENLDTTLHTVDEIEAVSELHTLAKIPQASKKQINIFQNDSSTFAEAFRNLATIIQLINGQQPSKVLLFMSAEPKQGKSMIVSNLAFSLAEAGKKVVVVDCDMRLPKLHSLFSLSNEFGLKDVLERKTGLTKALQKSECKDVTVLTSGSIPDHPSQLLGSLQMFQLIEKLSERFDYVLLDTPAFLAVADVTKLAPYADGLILVVRREHARREAIQSTNKFLALYPDRVIGRIVNQTEDNSNYGYYQNPKMSESQKVMKKIPSNTIFKHNNIL